MSISMFAQSNIKIDVKDTSLKAVMESVAAQSKYKFVYTGEINIEQKLTVKSENESIDRLLSKIFSPLNIAYTIRENQIVLSLKKAEETKTPKFTGIITDEENLPLPGVAVKNETTGAITVSNLDGRYTIEAKEGDVLVFSMIGMETSRSKVGTNSVINVSMKVDVILLGDVVVTGYQTLSKERATGSYSIVNSEVIAQKPTTNISSILNGLVPGLAVQNSSVEGQTRFIIRGVGTLQNNQIDRDPLIVVDGFPINGFSTEYNDDVLTNIKDPFSTINPNDIENITILKDAAATSIYGARAANGVIVITTKKGRDGTKLEITADALSTVSSKSDLDYAFNMASAENQFRYAELYNTYKPINLGSSDPYRSTSKKTNFSEAYALLYEMHSRGAISQEEYNQRKSTLIGYANQGLWEKDLNNYLFRNAVKQQYNMALRGSAERMTFSFSSSYSKDDSYMTGSGGDRVILNLQANTNITERLSFNVNLNTVFSNRDDNGTYISILKGYISPWSRLVDETGDFTHVPTTNTVYYPILMSDYEGKAPASWLYNPAKDMKYNNMTSSNLNYRISGGLNYKTDFGLNLRVQGQHEYGRYDSRSSYDAESYYVRDRYNLYSQLNSSTGRYESYFPAGGVFSTSGDRYKGYNIRIQADYDKTFDRHSISAIAGAELISNTTENVPSVTRYGFNRNTFSVVTTPDYITRNKNIFGANTYSSPFTSLGTLSLFEERFLSSYANLGYTFDEKYSITSSLRVDATNYQTIEMREKFSPFWSLGASYLISKDKYMQNVDWVNHLKVRASFGVAGVAAGKKGNSTVTTLATYPGNLIHTNNESFSDVSVRGNPTLTWEKSRTLNLGVDFALWQNSLSGSIDFYDRYSYDVLASASVPAISQGVSTNTFNNAKVRNTGIEATIKSNIKITDDFSWLGNLNFAYNKNTILEYNVTSSVRAASLDYLEGYPMNSIAVLKFKGYTPEGYVILEGKDGQDETIINSKTSHQTDQINRGKGETIDDLNYYYYLGTETPKYELAFSSAFKWKGLTLSFMITGRFDYYVYKNDFLNGTTFSSYSFSKHLDRSFEVYDQGYENQTEYVAAPLYNDANATTFLAGAANAVYIVQTYETHSYARGDHLRFQELYLGYELPKRILGKGMLNGLTVYTQATNLGLIYSAEKGFDPEYPYGSIKPMPTFSFGLKLNFK